MASQGTSPVIIQGQGGQLYYFFGNKAFQPLNMTLQTNVNSSFNRTIGKVNADRAGSNSATPVARMFFGGFNTFFPGAYANHKALAIYNNKLYQSLDVASVGGTATFITRFDGSGLFNFHPAGQENLSGPGTEILTASGVSAFGNSTDFAAYDLTHLVDNGALWMVGQISSVGSIAGNHMFQSEGWKLNGVDAADINTTGPSDRFFAVLSIHADSNGVEDRRFGPVINLADDVTKQYHNSACDLIAHKNDLYFATWVDLFRIHQSSGTFQHIRGDLAQPSAKSLFVYPSGGFSNGAAIGEDRVFMLTGSGILHRIMTSGTVEATNLNSINSDNRTGDNWFARINSSTAEPGRTPLTISLHDTLHTFLPTATSGYRHFTCTGDPSGLSNWTDRTESLPTPLKSHDSNVFGFSDGNFAYVAQITMGELGIFGHVGSKRTAGATHIYRITRNNQWQTLWEGAFDLPGRSMIPYTNFGPNLFAPSGSNPTYLKCSDYTILDYKLYDGFSRPVDIEVQYSENNGVTWQDARRFKSYSTALFLGSGTTNLATSPQGTSYDFYWDHVNDLGYNTNKQAKLRIRPKLRR